jgi:hypothetical protein
MSEADVTVAVSWGGLSGYYARTSTRDSSISLSKQS